MRPGQPNVSPERQVRILKAVELKLRGKSYRAIASDLGVSVSVAFDDVWHHFSEVDKLATEKLEQIRKLELARLDAMLEKLFDVMDRAPVADEGVYLDTDGTSIKAITAAAKLMERRAKLLGLDAPTKVEKTDPDEVARMSPEEKIAAHEKAILELREQKEARH